VTKDEGTAVDGVVSEPGCTGQAGTSELPAEPSRYKHWRVAFDGAVTTLTMDVAENGGIRPGYKLKLNSYDGHGY
jgi:benzoyl-CoA-dihydrodiol lyase